MLIPRTTGSLSYAVAFREARPPALAVREVGPAATPKPRLLDRVREAIRARHYSRRTEKTYVAWIRRYIFFHGKRHPAEMGATEITRFLTSLAVDSKVAASTQNQALSASCFCTVRSCCRKSRGWTISSMPSARTTCRSC